jgi:hypothetical protein
MKMLLNLVSCLALAGCLSPNRNQQANESASSWACSIEDRSISRFMGAAVDQLAQGSDQEWDEVSKIWSARRIDGIGATCFVVGLGELFARAPSVFLERHLSGDLTAKELAREGYNLLYSERIVSERSFDPDVVRSNALNLFRQRQAMEEDEITQKKIEDFMHFITKPR